MLFLSIFKYEPEKRNEVVKRRTEKGPMSGSETKIIGEWSSIAGGRVFRLVEVDDPQALFEGIRVWSDLGRVELIPVMTTEESIKLASSKK